MRLIGLAFYMLLLLASTLVGAESARPVTLAQYVFAVDWTSAGVAALIALIGGAARTATSLFKEGQTIHSALHETLKDAVLALVTGSVCFVVLGLFAAWYVPPLPAQAGFIFIAGFARGKFIDWLDVAFGKALDLGFDLASGWARKRVEAAGDQPKGQP
jgi:hypothetical protein